MALKSFVLEQFFVKKQSAEKNTAYSLPTPSGDDNNVLIKIYMYVFNCLPLKQISNDGQKNLPKVTWPYQSKQPLRQYCTLDKFLFFCRLINKNVLEWFLPVISKERTLKKSTNLGRNHLTLWFSFRREGQQMPNTIQIPITNFWAVTFSTYRIACLEFFRAFTSENIQIVHESRYVTLFVFSGSTAKLFSICLFSIFFSINFSRWKSKANSWKLSNSKYMITSTQISNNEILTFIALLIFKLLSRKTLFTNRKNNRNC